MNINFSITEKSGKISPNHDGYYGIGMQGSTKSGDFGFLHMVWMLLKWYWKVKKQACHSQNLRVADRLNYVFRIRQVLTIETEN